MKKSEEFLSRWLPYVTAAWVCLMVLSLKFRFLDYFAVTTWHGRPGVDFFAVPRSFINLVHHQSIYATRQCDWGPYAAWFPYHPALSVLLGSWLSLFKPWTAYSVFAGISIAVFFYCGLLARQFISGGVLGKLAYFLPLCSIPAYLTIWNGQVHVLVALAFCLVLADLLEPPGGIRWKLVAGVLLSLFSKPLILTALPALFALRRCRRPLAWCLAVYAAVSLAFLAVPFLNPQPVGFDNLVDVLLHPAKLFHAEVYKAITLVVYRPEFVRDNAIHWLNMKTHAALVQTGHFEYFSLPSFLGNIIGGQPPAFISKIPLLIIAALSAAAYFIKREEEKILPVLFTVFMGALAFYLSYDTVYEYHYCVILAALPFLLAVYERETAPALKWCCAAGALLVAPTAYFWIKNPAFGHHTAQIAGLPDIYVAAVVSGNPYGYFLTMMRWSRVMPALAMFLLLAWLSSSLICRSFRREN